MEKGQKFNLNGTDYEIERICDTMVSCVDYNRNYYTYFSVGIVKEALNEV
jgi:hypothetical protein